MRHLAWIAVAAIVATALTGASLNAQESATLSGRVVAVTDGAPIAGATVRLPGMERGVLTDEEGRFLLAGLAPGRHQLVVRRIGFETIRRRVTLGAGERRDLTLRLPASAVRTEDLVVTATRTEERMRDVAASVSVLSTKQVESNPGRTADDLLRVATSVNLPRASSTVTHPTAQSVSIRGTGRPRTLVLLDGIPLNDAFGGWIRWGLAPKSMVDRVEVLRGGGSSLFGTYAMGGVIQLFSRRPEGNDFRARGNLGERELRHGDLYASRVTGDWAFSLAGQLESGGGFVEVAEDDRGPVDIESSSARRNLTGRVEFTPSEDRRFWLLGSLVDENRDNGTPLQDNERTIGTLALGTEIGSGESGLWRASVFGSVHRFDNKNSRTFDGRARETLTKDQDVPVEDVGASLLWSRQLADALALTVGTDVRFIDGTNEEVQFAVDGSVDQAFDTGGKQLLSGLFLQSVVTPVDPVRFEGSLRIDSWNSFDAFKDFRNGPDEELASADAQELSPRLGLTVEVTEEVSVRGAAYRTFRAPTPNELFRGFFASNLSFEPNPSLRPETLYGAEAGVDWRPIGGLRLSTTGFWNQIEDRIDFIFEGFREGQGRLRRQNIGKTRLRGAEAEVGYRLGDRLEVTANYTFVDSEILGSANEEDIGNEVPDVPQDQVNLQVTWDGPQVGQLGVTARFVGQEFEDDENTIPLNDHFVVGLDYRRDLYGGVGVFATVENLFDETVVSSDRGGITRIGLPQTVRAGLSYDLF